MGTCKRSASSVPVGFRRYKQWKQALPCGSKRRDLGIVFKLHLVHSAFWKLMITMATPAMLRRWSAHRARLWLHHLYHIMLFSSARMSLSLGYHVWNIRCLGWVFSPVCPRNIQIIPVICSAFLSVLWQQVNTATGSKAEQLQALSNDNLC